MSEATAFKSFVSETELDEKRQKRQEEWDKVRTAEQPEECPEEEIDNRSLYDRLQEQKDKKQEEFDDKHQFKNMVRGLEDDESKFLGEVAVRQMELEMRKRKEEKDILMEAEEFRDRVLTVEEPTSSTKPTQEKKKLSDAVGVTKKKSQASLLAGAVKRKTSTSAEESNAKKSKTEETNPLSSSSSPPIISTSTTHSASSTTTPAGSNGTVQTSDGERMQRAQCVAVLPGLGHYQNSDDSDTSESASEEELDLTGPLVRQPMIKKKIVHQSH